MNPRNVLSTPRAVGRQRGRFTRPARSGPRTPMRRGKVVVGIALVVVLMCSSGAAARSVIPIPPSMPPPTGALFSDQSSPMVMPLGSSSGYAVSPRSLLAISFAAWCSGQTWSPIQQNVNKLVIGNCYSGWSLNATQEGQDPNTLPPQSPVWWGGYIGQGGSFSSCGWVNINWVSFSGSPNPTPGTCQNPSRLKTDFVFCGSAACPVGDSGTNLYIWTSANGNDGVWYSNPRTCSTWKNYRPWLTGRNPTDRQADIGAGQGFFLRYLAKYPALNGSGHYALVRTNALGWVFVPWSCVW